jgi:hypothetical protein
LRYFGYEKKRQNSEDGDARSFSLSPLYKVFPSKQPKGHNANEYYQVAIATSSSMH